jgi:flagellar protein FliO/FliZ
MNWFVITLLLCVAMIGGGLVLRSMMTGGPLLPALGQRPEKRLQVVEQASIDGRRRLILIRRDNVEHLVMTGGPVDLVVETGIGAVTTVRPRVLASDVETRKEPVAFGRVRTQPVTPAATPTSAGAASGAAAGE